MQYDNEAFLKEYPLSVDVQEAIDIANRGDYKPLVIILTGSLKAISSLSTRIVKNSCSQNVGLSRYYRCKIAALISLVRNPSKRSELESIYIGE